MPALKHLGQFRDISIGEASLQGKLLVVLFQRGRLGEGIAARFCKTTLQDPLWEPAVEKLAQWKFIEIAPAYHGEARWLSLSPTGQDEARDIDCQRQISSSTDATTAARRAAEERVARGEKG